MTVTTCPICEEPETTVLSKAANFSVNCPGCGSFRISGSATRSLARTPISTTVKRANARGWIRANQDVHLQQDDVVRLEGLTAPSVSERAETLLLAINRNSPTIGSTTVMFEGPKPLVFWYANSWSHTSSELFYLARQYLAVTKGWLIDTSASEGYLNFQISPSGYDYLARMQASQADADHGFCAMWFDDEVSSTWYEAIQPAILAAGYKAIRIDGVQHNNKIDDEILAAIRRAKFVVADFTGGRGGVYFEAGFALGLGRQVIWMVRKDALNAVHFDNRQYNFLLWSGDELSSCKLQLQNRIEATIGRGPW